MRLKKLISLLTFSVFAGALAVSAGTASEAAPSASKDIFMSEPETTAETEAPAPEENSEAALAPLPDDTVIAEGVFIGDFDLSGKTRGEAAELINDYINQLQSKQITLNITNKQETVTASELGFSWNNAEVVDKAAALGTQGNLITRYKALTDLKTENKVLSLDITYDDGMVAGFVDRVAEKYDIPAKNATLTRSGGKFVVGGETLGLVTNKEETTANLLAAIRENKAEPQLSVDGTVAESRPARTADALSKVKNVLGSYTTTYNQGNVGRSKNLSTAVAKINGSVLMPGEIFSGYEKMAPFTVSNGYAAAGAYQNGVVIESVGGGACQIATTIYNAVLLAELEVTQRQNHSMVVHYVPYSFDAAIAGTYKDIKFRNNYDSPIYIECSASGGNLTFVIYGNDTRPSNRTIKYQSVTVSESYPQTPIITESKDYPAGFQKQEQGPYPGVTSQLWKYVYVDGVQTEKTMVNSDRYNSSPARIIVGTGAAEAAAEGEAVDPNAPPAEPTEPGETQQPSENPAPRTETPAVTEAPAEPAEPAA